MVALSRKLDEFVKFADSQEEQDAVKSKVCTRWQTSNVQSES
jgi:hypothetical protein